MFSIKWEIVADVYVLLEFALITLGTSMFAGLHTVTLLILKFALTNGCVMGEHWTWHATFYPVLKMTKTNQGCVQRGGD